MRANRSTLVKLCLLTALAVPVQRAASAAIQDQNLGQSLGDFQANASVLLAQDIEFVAPASLEGSDTLAIDGSSSMRSMNEALAEQFEGRYESATVESATSGTDIALAQLLNGEIDLAAIGRPLTEEEVAAGLVAVPVAREKIAIFVSPENPFSGDITFEEFGGIFRGEITEWENVDDGSGSGALRFVDRPETSDTRLAFRPYPVFQAAPFETGFTADPVAADETEAVIEALGADGIGYAIANQVMGNPNVKIVPMHQTLPDNPAYPFSQPRNYVYLNEPSPAVEGFLAVATSPEGVDVIEEVRATEGAAAAQLEAPAASVTSPDGTLTARTDENNVAVIENADGTLVSAPLAGAGGAVTALAFSPDGETLATGTQTGKVRFWGVDGEPKGEAFDAVLGADNAITELEFRENDKLFVAGSQGRQGLWGLNGLPFGETAGAAAGAAAGTAGAAAAASQGDGKFPWWLLWIPLLGLLGGLGWWLLGRNRRETVAEPKRQTAPTATVPPPVSDPDNEREVSSRAHTVISTDRVVDESRAVGTVGAVDGAVSGREIAAASVGAEGISAPGLGTADLAVESTDLESPELEDTNLDLSGSGLGLGGVAVGGAALGGAALGGAAIVDGLDSGVEEGQDDEEWDDNLDLTLDDAPSEDASGEIAFDAAVPDVAVPDVAVPESIADAMPLVDVDVANSADSSADAVSASMPSVGLPGDTAAGTDFSNLSTSSAAGIDDDDFWNTSPAGGAAAAGLGAAGLAAAAVGAGSSPGSDETDLSSLDLSEGADSEAVAAENSGLEDLDLQNSGLENSGLENSGLENSGLENSDLENIEPTRDTVIAETDAVPDIEPDQNTIIGDNAVIFGGAAASDADAAAVGFANAGSMAVGIAGGGATAVALSSQGVSQSGGDNQGNRQANNMAESGRSLSLEELADVDDTLSELPDGYGESRIVLLPRDPKWAYAYWDIPFEHKQALREQGGQRLMLRLYDVTDVDQGSQAAHGMQQSDCDEMARSWYVEIPVSDRDYTAEIGYLTADDRWLVLARSAPMRVPPIYPSDWVKDQFVTIDFDETLVGRTFGNLGRPDEKVAGDAPVADLPPLYSELFAPTQGGQNALWVAGSLFGSMHQVPPAGLTTSGMPTGAALSASGLNMSGLNMSGLNMSGVGMGDRKRNFWLVADAELIVYGATEPDATLTIGDQVVPLSKDGTFRFHVAFPDGNIDYPIKAVAADGEQSRSVTMNFERETPERNTNTKEDAKDEWF